MRELTNGRPLPCWVSCYLFTVLTGPTSHLLTSLPLPRPKRRTATWRDTWHRTTSRYKVLRMRSQNQHAQLRVYSHSSKSTLQRSNFPDKQSRPWLSRLHGRLLLLHMSSLKVQRRGHLHFHSTSDCLFITLVRARSNRVCVVVLSSNRRYIRYAVLLNINVVK